MPFTLSHAVLAPPLSKLSRGKVPIAALAVGCMTPDLFRLFTDENITISHEWSGLLVPDLPVGLLFCLLWYVLYRPAVYMWLGLKDEILISNINQFCGFVLACMVGIIVGSVTHLIWDGLTHDDFRSFAFKHLLGEDMWFLGRDYPVHRFLQFANSFVFLPVVLWMCYRYIQKHRTHEPISKKLNIFFWIILGLALCIGGYGLWHYLQHIDAQIWTTQTYNVTGKAINAFSRSFLMSFSVGCLVFLVITTTFYKMKKPD